MSSGGQSCSGEDSVVLSESARNIAKRLPSSQQGGICVWSILGFPTIFRVH